MRRHRAEKTPLGLQAQPYMDKGELVPDEIIIGMMESDLPRDRGFILDGFPRTLPQAEALDAMLRRSNLPLTAVLSFEAQREELIKRLTGRWTNPRNGRVYHEITCPPRTPGIDDEDGGSLVQRPDDTVEVVTQRLDVYERQTKPLIAFYQKSGLLRQIDAMRPVDEVAAEIDRALAALGGVAAS